MLRVELFGDLPRLAQVEVAVQQRHRRRAALHRECREAHHHQQRHGRHGDQPRAPERLQPGQQAVHARHRGALQPETIVVALAMCRRTPVARCPGDGARCLDTLTAWLTRADLTRCAA